MSEGSLRNRITERRRMLGSELNPNSKNYRQHPKAQAAALKGILEEVGQVGELYAYHSERNGGKLTLIDGHLRSEQFAGEAWDVAITDLNDAEADKLLLVYDPLAAMATANKDALDSLLRDVQTGDEGLAAMITQLAARNGIGELNDPAAEWQGMPEFEQEDLTGIKAIIHFDTVDDQREFEKLIGQKIPDNTHSIWYPKKQRANLRAMGIVDEPEISGIHSEQGPMGNAAYDQTV